MMPFIVYGLMPVLAAIISILIASGVFYMALHRKVQPEVILFFIVTTAGALGYFLSARDLSTLDAKGLIEDSGETSLARIANFSALLLCFVAFIQTCLTAKVNKTAAYIFVTSLLYYFVCFIYPASFDRWFVFDHTLIYPFIALFLILAPSSLSALELATVFRRAANIPVILSLLLLAVKHKTAMLDSYESILPILPGRLFGATPHPNIMGSLSTFALLLLAAFPTKRKWEFWLFLVADLATLILSQSKTSWITLLIGVLIIKLPILRRANKRVPAFLAVAGFLAIVAVPAFVSVANHSLYASWSGNQNIQSLGTLTGRTDIWKASLFLIVQHPITGPGYATFQLYMQSFFPDLVPNPHNLYLATLLQAGVFGLISLVIYLATLTVAAFKLSGPQRLFCIAYVALIFVRGLSESFTLQAAFIGPNFWALIMFMRLLSVSASEQTALDSNNALKATGSGAVLSPLPAWQPYRR